MLTRWVKCEDKKVYVNDDKQCSGEWHFVSTNSLTYIFDTNRMLIISSRAIIPSRFKNRSTMAMDNTITSGRMLIVKNYINNLSASLNLCEIIFVCIKSSLYD